MKLSELIETLSILKDQNGDIEVYAWPYDGQGSKYQPVVNVVFNPPAQPIVFVEGE